MAMGLIRLVREHTDFPIHKYAAHVIRKVSHHPVTGVWRAEGWKTGEQHRFRLQIRRVLGANVDINRLFERLQPARWTGDDIADAFWTFFLRNVYGATAFPDVVDVKRELVVKKTTSAQQAGAFSAASRGRKNTEPYVLSDAFFHRRGLSRDAFVHALEACVKHPDETFPGWLAAAGWDDVTAGPRDPAEYLLPPPPPPSKEEPPKETIGAKVERSGKKRRRGDVVGEVSDDGASGATDATRVSARAPKRRIDEDARRRRRGIKTVDKNGRQTLGSLADDDAADDDDDARSAPGRLGTPTRRRRRPDEDGVFRNGAGKGTRTAADDDDDDGRKRFVAAAASLASATQLGDVQSVAAALRTLKASALTFDAWPDRPEEEATTEGDGAKGGDPFASLAVDVFAEYNRDLMADDSLDAMTESVFDDDASVFDEGDVMTSRVRILEAPPVEGAGIERLCSIPEDAETDLLDDLLAASPRC